MNLTEIVEAYVRGELPVDDLPAVAADILEAGHDTPSLKVLAGSQGTDPELIRKLFHAVLYELGVPVPSLLHSALALARRIAGDINRGAISPYDGAKQIWTKVYVKYPQLSELRLFVGLASEYEDDEAHRDQYSRDIVEESQRLLQRHHDLDRKAAKECDR